MKKRSISLGDMTRVFLKTGAYSFGGWTTTALLLEKELVVRRKVITKDQFQCALAYAQILPGATQVAIVSHVGYKLRGISGAFLTTTCYLLPALSLITVFAVAYFHFMQGSQFSSHLGGLIAALGGVIFANAYQIGKHHVTHWVMWAFIFAAFAAKLWFEINVVLILLLFGAAGLIYSWIKMHREDS